MVVNYCTYSCYRSTTAVAFQALIMATLFLLQAIGIFLAFQTRKVKVKVLNDAKQVTAIIYVTSVCVLLIIMTTFALGSFLNTSSAVFSFSIAAASTAFLILIFIPKVEQSLSLSFLSLSLSFFLFLINSTLSITPNFVDPLFIIAALK